MATLCMQQTAQRTCFPSWALLAGSGSTAAPAAMAPARFCAYVLHRSSMVMDAYLYTVALSAG